MSQRCLCEVEQIALVLGRPRGVGDASPIGCHKQIIDAGVKLKLVRPAQVDLTSHNCQRCQHYDEGHRVECQDGVLKIRGGMVMRRKADDPASQGLTHKNSQAADASALNLRRTAPKRLTFCEGVR